MRLSGLLLADGTLLSNLATASPVSRRQVKLCKVEHCYPAFTRCIEDCDSLKNGDW